MRDLPGASIESVYASRSVFGWHWGSTSLPVRAMNSSCAVIPLGKKKVQILLRRLRATCHCDSHVSLQAHRSGHTRSTSQAHVPREPVTQRALEIFLCVGSAGAEGSLV